MGLPADERQIVKQIEFSMVFVGVHLVDPSKLQMEPDLGAFGISCGIISGKKQESSPRSLAKSS